jgi:hypothetical protein
LGENFVLKGFQGKRFVFVMIIKDVDDAHASAQDIVDFPMTRTDCGVIDVVTYLPVS